MSDQNFYEILGVRPDASQAEIRAAYLKLAKQWHPDRNTGNEAEAERRFKEIAHAYEVLSNSEKRAAYDAASKQSSGFENTMDEADAFDLFISVLLDLAFELAENGADQITIYQALVDMGCPSGTAKTLAQKAHQLGGNVKADASRGETTKTNNAAAQNKKNDCDLPSGNVENTPANKSEGRWRALWLIPFALFVAILLGDVLGKYQSPKVEATDAALVATEEAVEVADDKAIEVPESETQQKFEPQEPTLNLEQPAPQYNLNESILDPDEKLALRMACINAQMQGPAEYNQCVQYQISKMNPANRRTDKTTLTQDERLSLRMACINAQMEGPEAHNQCVNYQMSKMGR
jgi:curved DNA-binding protein CbpA